jgi:two-component system NtrC family sensor kinase
MKLKHKLFLVLVLMTMVPLLILFFEVVGRIETDLEQRASTELQKTLSKMSAEISNLMNNQKALVNGLAKVPIVREFAVIANSKDEESLYDDKAVQLMAFFLNYQSTVPSIQAIRFTDMEGHSLVKIKEGRLVPNKERLPSGRAYVEDIAYKPFFKWAVKTDEDMSISDFERGKVSGEIDFCPSMVRYTVPIRDDLDIPLGLLTVNMWGRRVDHAVQASLGGYPGKAYIVEVSNNPERDGIYLYHDNPDMRFSNQLGTGHKLSTEIGEKYWRKIREGSQKGLVQPDQSRMLFYRKFSPYTDRETKWALVIESSMNTILEPVSKLRDWLLYLMLAVLLISLFVAHWAACKLAKPVNNLARIITRFADGDREAKYTDTRKDEIGIAGKAFNYLTSTLDRSEKERAKAELAARQSERLAAVGQMAAGIGHEINNPLMNIMSLASLVEQNIPKHDVQLRDDLKALQSEGRRCARIVQGILNFARETPPSYQHFDFAELIDDTMLVFEHRLRASEVYLDVDIERPLMMDGDAGLLQQVLVNVIINALHASAPGSKIVVNAAKVGQTIKVLVMDNGQGISEENISRVFSPFFTTKPEGSGTGLGLSVSYGIVKKHGGSISLENRPEGGVCVTIQLPVEGMHANASSEHEDLEEMIGIKNAS